MATFKDRAGKLWEFDNADDALRQGMVEASGADIDAHNDAVDAEEKQKAYDAQPLGDRIGDTLTAGGQAFARQAMAPGMMLTEALTGQRPGQVPQEQLPPDQRSALGEGVFSDEARARRERHPLAAGLGGAAALAPAAAAAGMGVAALAPAAGAIFGTTVPAMLTEAAVTAVPQEYDDAWLEQRPMQLSNVAANTLAFAGVDFLFRGALHGISALGASKAAKPSAIGGRNVVSEAQGAARELVEPAGHGSVGAASARDMLDQYDGAIAQMSDSEAATLARDSEDHLFLVAQDASESMTRLNNGLSEDLGSQLKYEDIHSYAQDWHPEQLEKQAKWFTRVSEGAEDAIATLRESEFSLGNYGKRAEQLLDTFNRRIADEADAGQRMVLGDSYKKQFDRLTKSLDASDLDSVAKDEIKAAIAPTRESLRKGLERADMFGGAADLQKGVNAPWTTLLTSWRKVQDMLTEATGHIKFDDASAGRMTRESTVDRMMSLAEKDPRRNQEFGQHLGTVLDGFNGLIEARQAYGIARTDGLDALATDVRNLMDDWNLATTVGVARNRVRIMKTDPRKWGVLAANIGERLPLVGKPIQIARSLGDALTDLHLPKKSATGKVWNAAYERFAKNPVYSDPSIARNYPDWIMESLRARGGTPPPAGAVGTPSVPSMSPANEVQRSVAQAGPSASVAGPAGMAGAAAMGAGALLAPDAGAVEPEPPPVQAPEVAYRDALREIDKAGDQQVKTMASEALRLKPPRGKSRGPLELFTGKRKIQDAVESTRERLDEISADPTSLIQQLGGSSGELARTHPGVYQAVAQKAAQVAAYLQQSLPARTATTLLDPVGAKPSFDRSWDYAARYVGATQPRAALREVVRGNAPPEMLEAVQQAWPELWSAFQVEMLGQVQRMSAAGRHIPSEKLRRLDSLLGMGGQLDPSASHEVTAHFLAAQDADAAKRQQAGQQSGAMSGSSPAPAASQLRTRLGTINQERNA